MRLSRIFEKVSDLPVLPFIWKYRVGNGQRAPRESRPYSSFTVHVLDGFEFHVPLLPKIKYKIKQEEEERRDGREGGKASQQWHLPALKTPTTNSAAGPAPTLPG